jgi:hypothetical protein
VSPRLLRLRRYRALRFASKTGRVWATFRGDDAESKDPDLLYGCGLVAGADAASYLLLHNVRTSGGYDGEHERDARSR